MTRDEMITELQPVGLAAWARLELLTDEQLAALIDLRRRTLAAGRGFEWPAFATVTKDKAWNLWFVHSAATCDGEYGLARAVLERTAVVESFERKRDAIAGRHVALALRAAEFAARYSEELPTLLTRC